MFQGFFKLKTKQDLLDKLNREYLQLLESPLNQDIAFNFLVTAEHMVDWVYPDNDKRNDKRSERKRLRNSNQILQICSHIASGAKHFKATASKHKSVSGTSVEGSYQRNTFQSDAHDVECLKIDLDGDAAKELGSSIEVVDLARRILKFWEDNMNAHPL